MTIDLFLCNLLHQEVSGAKVGNVTQLKHQPQHKLQFQNRKKAIFYINLFSQIFTIALRKKVPGWMWFYGLLWAL